MIKLTRPDKQPVYVKHDAVSYVMLTSDSSNHTHLGGLDISVCESPEEVRHAIEMADVSRT